VSRNEDGEIDLQKFLVPLRDENGTIQAIVLAVPFLRPSDVPLVPDAADPYLDGIRELYRLVAQAAREMRSQLCPDAALIAMGHCHLSGGEESSDSERRLVIGGAEAVSPGVFGDDVAYVALGHLHKAQQFDAGRIRYCGSPIPLSFAEANYWHRLFKVALGRNEADQNQPGQNQLVRVDDILIPRTTTMMRVPSAGSATIDVVLRQLEELTLDVSLPPEQHPFLEVRVLEDGPDPTRRKRIEQAIEGKPVRLASLKVVSAARIDTTENSDPAQETVDLKMINPEEIFLSAHLEKFGTAADDAMIHAFREILLQETQAQ
jgi:exonuclease SbcD